MHKVRSIDLKRKKDFRPTRKNFLIVCEGEKTEPKYFEGFRLSKDIYDLEGLGTNTVSLVEQAIKLKNRKDKSYDQVWCVFDRDSFPQQNYNNAFTLAERNNIKIAYSNEAFEIWYLLHFHYHDAATSRGSYKKMLTERLGFRYEKNDPKMYDHLISKQTTAIKNSMKLFDSYANHLPANENPSTTVHELVQELNKYIV
ncbi:MAG: RloB domain-containing protein [Deltaproteobacteria bacterium]|nr:RloB domain-containing protein [Deltaproteobacteria bacterium]